MVRVFRRAGEEAVKVPLEDGVGLILRAIDDEVSEIEGLDAADLEILRFVARAALASRSLEREHLEPLRAVGLNDREIHDVANVVCGFSYMNRLADSLGVALLADRAEWAERLLGKEALAAHLAWGSPTA